MFITPNFEVDQTEETVTVRVALPYSRAKDIDYVADEECTLRVHCKPYFLRLVLPGQILTDGTEKASYDVDKGLFTLVAQKAEPGRHFDGLDMLTRLLTKTQRGAAPPLPLIQPADDDAGACSLSSASNRAVEYDWEVEQQLPSAHPPGDDLLKISYGFNSMFSEFFEGLQFELSEIVDIPSPDTIAPSLRATLRMAREAQDFSVDHYMADYMDGEAIVDIMQQPPLWWEQSSSSPSSTLNSNSTSSSSTCSSFSYGSQDSMLQDDDPMEGVTSSLDPSSLFSATPAAAALPSRQQGLAGGAQQFGWTEEQKEVLVSHLKNREHLLLPAEEKSTALALVDLVFAYAYDHRTTYGEPTVESAWTVAKLSGTLSWFASWGSLGQVLQSCVRRSLVYPLHRHWGLALRVVKDTYRIMMLGRRAILRCLVDIRIMMEKSDQRFYLNRLYIDHFCVWIQQAPAAVVQTLPRGIKWYQPSKDSSGWPLEEFERVAQEIAEEDVGPSENDLILQDD